MLSVIRLVGARYVIVYVEFLSFFHMFIFLCAVILQLYVVGSCPFDLGEKICMYVSIFFGVEMFESAQNVIFNAILVNFGSI